LGAVGGATRTIASITATRAEPGGTRAIGSDRRRTASSRSARSEAAAPPRSRRRWPGPRGTPFVLDHLGKPDIAGGGFDAGRPGFEALARCENVSCKLSGLVTGAATYRAWRETTAVLLDELSPREARQVDSTTAGHVYGAGFERS
jgi:hypothetical protein